MIFNREPVMFQAAVMAAVALAVGFGLNWSGEQVALVATFTEAVLAFVARSQVTPVSK